MTQRNYNDLRIKSIKSFLHKERFLKKSIGLLENTLTVMILKDILTAIKVRRIWNITVINWMRTTIINTIQIQD